MSKFDVGRRIGSKMTILNHPWAIVIFLARMTISHIWIDNILGFLPKLRNDCDKVMRVVDNMKEISFFSIWQILDYWFMSCQRSREVFFDENDNVNYMR